MCGRFIRLFNFLLSYLAVLYAGACVLFTIGLMGLFSFCVFMYILSFGAIGFMFIRYLCACLFIYTTKKNTQEVAEELKIIHFDDNMKIITLDIKDLYVNLPIQGILQTTKFWLNKHNNTSTTIEQILKLLETILKQNHFQ